MRLAIPIWQDRISPVLDSASRLLIVDIENQREVSRFETVLDEQDLSRRSHRIRDIGVDVLICSAVSRPFSRMLELSGIELIHEISGATEEILDAYFKGDLIRGRFLMPGCRRNRSGKRIGLNRSHGKSRQRTGGKGRQQGNGSVKKKSCQKGGRNRP